MGMPNRLHGKLVPLSSGKKKICKNCFRFYSAYKIITEDERSKKVCPFCNHEIKLDEDQEI